MRLPFFRAKDSAADPARPRRGGGPGAADDGPVQAARTQARRRLVGALVLLAAGVIGFPVLFETQPRPLPVDLPILVAEGAVPRSVSAASSRPLPTLPPDAGSEATLEAAPVSEPLSAASEAALSVDPASSPLRAAPSVAAPPPASASSRPQAAGPDAAKPNGARSEPVKPEPPKPAKAPSSPEVAPGRFVVQVGAFNEAERLKAARQKVEKLGYKSYTQDVETATGKRTRLRVGPYASRQEAEAVAGKLKAGGMPANILTL
jgi:DedD protein